MYEPANPSQATRFQLQQPSPTQQLIAPQPIAITIQNPSLPEPHWTAYATALGAPFVALVAACIAGSIAYRQWKTAQNKLKMDLFDKRFEVYKDVENVLAKMLHREFGPGSYGEFRSSMNKVDWLFDDSIKKYLDDEWNTDVQRFDQTETELKELKSKGLEVANELHTERNLIIARLLSRVETLRKHFRPYFKLSHE